MIAVLQAKAGTGGPYVWSEMCLIFHFYFLSETGDSPEPSEAPCEEALTSACGSPSPGVRPAAGGAEALAPLPAHRAPGARVQRGGGGPAREARPRVHVEGTGRDFGCVRPS